MNKQQRKTWADCMALLMSELPKEDASVVYDKTVLRWYFCDSDDITYRNLRKVGFRRTQTLGKGGEWCDFEFYRKDGAEKQ